MGSQVIRECAESDLPELMRMARDFLACTAFCHVELDEASLTKLVSGLNGETGVVLVAERDGKLCGMIAMVAFPHYFNASVLAAQEFFWWVDPSARGTSVSIRLLERAEQWARDRGCQTVHMLSLDKLNGENVEKLYRRRGYEPLERTYMRVM
jgi:GNAT superfamily N-acetyltransferase